MRSGGVRRTLGHAADRQGVRHAAVDRDRDRGQLWGWGKPGHGDRPGQLASLHTRGVLAARLGDFFHAPLPALSPEGERGLLLGRDNPLVSEVPALNVEGAVPSRLPVLPLKSTVVFPRIFIPLSVGRKRSLQLLEDLTGSA